MGVINRHQAKHVATHIMWIAICVGWAIMVLHSYQNDYQPVDTPVHNSPTTVVAKPVPVTLADAVELQP